MISAPIIVAALAMMGAPVSTPVSCATSPVALQLADGLTTFLNGAPVIQFSPRVCAGLAYMAEGAKARKRSRQRNPNTPWVQDEGVASVVVLHEAHHAAGDRSEASTQCAAMRAVDGFIGRYVPLSDRYRAMQYAEGYNASLPPSYHESGCN